MIEPVILTFDIGTQSMRGMLVTKTGDFEAFEQIHYDEPYFSLNPSWAEQKPNFYYDKLCEVSQILKAKHETAFENIIGVTVTTMRDTAICLDINKKPLRDIILWLDKRESKQAAVRVPLWLRIALRIARMRDVFDRQLRMAPCNWIKAHEKSIWKKTDKYVMLPTYMNYLMTGNLTDSIANMIGYIPIDYKGRKWEKHFGVMKYIANIDSDKLIDFCNPGEVVGFITETCHEQSGIPMGLPLIATGSDKSCESLGVGATKSNEIAASFGTTVTVQICAKNYITPAPFAPAYPSVYKNNYNSEIQIYRGYWMLSWFKKEIGVLEALEAKKLGITIEQLLSKKLFNIPAGCDGLMLQPYWGSGVLNPHSKGAMIGFSEKHTRMHIYKAIVEGLGFAVLEGMQTLQKRQKKEITRAYLSGGGSQSDEICQIMSSIAGIPIYKMQTHEACGLGSSIVAFVALDVFSDYDEAIKSMCHVYRIFAPNWEEHKIYKNLYNDVYVKMFGKLEPLYKKIIDIVTHSTLSK